MAKAKDLSVPANHSDVTAVIEYGCEFEGKLCFQGTVRIGGIFRGEIFTTDTLIVGETARIFGNIHAGAVIVNGEVNGNIKAKNRVEIQSPAIFRGEIQAPSLKVDEGVIFEGSSRMVHAVEIPQESLTSIRKKS